ncbi:MAG: TonB-dependent receptor [Fibrobacteria bacterium]|nr:TonB-dependent receptor [Fibrobacteria bacterium]
MIKRKRLTCILFLVLMTGLLMPLLAETYVQDSAATFELRTLSVKSEKQYTSRHTVSHNILTSEDFKILGVSTLAQALPWLPGIQVRRGKRGEAYVRFRGFRQREVLILLDNIPVNSPFSNQFDLEKIPLEHIARIELLKGVSSVLFGAGGLGGVINITTKKALEKLEAGVGVDVRSGHDLKGVPTGKSAELSGNFGTKINNHRIFTAGRYVNSEGFSLPLAFKETRYQEPGTRLNSDRHEGGVFASYYHENTKGTALEIMGDVNGGAFGRPPTIGHRYDYPRYERVDGYVDAMLNMAVHKRIQEGLPGFLREINVSGAVYGSNSSSEENRYSDDSFTEKKRHYEIRDNTAGLLLLGRLQSGIGILSASLIGDFNVRRIEGRDDELVDNRYESLALSAGLEYSKNFFTQFDVTAGLAANLLFPLLGREKFGRANDPDKLVMAEMCPQAGIAWRPFNGARVFANLGKKTRNPSLKELYILKEEVDGIPPSLEPEVSWNYEAGVDGSPWAWLFLSGTGFYYDITNLIENNNTTNLTENIPAVATFGTELEAALSSRVGSFSLNYTFLSMAEKGNEERQEMQYRPRHSFAGRLEMQLPGQVRINGGGRYTGKQSFYSYDNIAYADTTVEVEPYFIIDAGVRVLVKQKLELGFRIYNIFDIFYEESYALPRPGRTFSFQLFYRIK